MSAALSLHTGSIGGPGTKSTVTSRTSYNIDWMRTTSVMTSSRIKPLFVGCPGRASKRTTLVVSSSRASSFCTLSVAALVVRQCSSRSSSANARSAPKRLLSA